MGNTGSRVAKETLYGLEEIPWRTLCARKQLVGNSGRGCRPPAPRAKSMKFLGHPNYAPGLCAALCAVLEIASWLSLADLDVPWIEEANRWGDMGGRSKQSEEKRNNKYRAGDEALSANRWADMAVVSNRVRRKRLTLQSSRRAVTS